MIRLVGGIALVAAMGFPLAAHAQEITLSLGDGPSLAGRTIQLILLVTVLSLAPGLLMMVTCFPFLVTVLAILRQAIGLQQSPPNMLLVALALFLTWFVMEPVFNDAWQVGIEPLINEQLPAEEAIAAAAEPFHAFMSARADPETLTRLADLRVPGLQEPETGWSYGILVPGFLLSEIGRAFEIGFMIYLPFLIIDLVVAAILMSMGMMMVPPAVVSLPFKLAFFVAADGWTLLAEALVRGYAG